MMTWQGALVHEIFFDTGPEDPKGLLFTKLLGLSLYGVKKANRS
jgi:hypothetical protein